MEKLKELLKKLNLKVAMVGGAIVVTTSLGTCHFAGDDEASEPATAEEAPAEEALPDEEAPAEEPAPDAE